jgi:hypothetical protein
MACAWGAGRFRCAPFVVSMSAGPQSADALFSQPKE